MKTIRYSFLALIILAISNTVLGAPFLTSEPYRAKTDKPVKFLVTIGGKTVVSMPVKKADGSVYLKYDLGSLPDGTYAVSVKAVDKKGMESAPSVCSITKTGFKGEISGSPASKNSPPAQTKKAGSDRAVRQDAGAPAGPCTGFLDKTAGLRSEFEAKRQKYWELKRDPKIGCFLK